MQSGNMNINGVLQQVMGWKNKGFSPEQVMSMLAQQNPQVYQQLAQLKNMANGKSPREFVLQMAKQNGVPNDAMQMINQIMGGVKQSV